MALRAQQRPLGQQPPTFRSGTQVVEVDVRVFDKDGRFVTDLRPEDFDIKEDGAAQAITTATLIGGEPGTLNPNGNPRTPNPTSELPTPRTEPQVAPATWIYFFDTPHLSPGGLDRSRASVADFVRARMHQGDLAGIIANGAMLGNRLTTDREELERDLASIKLPGDTERIQRELKFEFPRLADQYEAYMIAERDDPDALGKAVRRGCADEPKLCDQMDMLVKTKAQAVDGPLHDAARLTVTSLRALSHGLARMAGTKSIVFVSEGFMLPHVQSELRDAIGEANRAGAHIYAIDVRGLNKGHAADLLLAPREDDPEDGVKFDEQADGPNSLALETGGLFIENQNDLGRVLDTIQRDTGTYYVVGYTPTNQSFDGKYRAIAVTVRRAGVKVRARRGYLAIEPAKLLRPVPAAPTAPSTPPAGSDAAQNNPENPPEPPGETNPATAIVAASMDPSAADSTAIRTRIEKGGLLAGLPGEGTAPADDPASRGWAAYQKGDVDTAARELRQAAGGADARPWVHYVLGFCELALHHYPDAAAAWERVRAAVPAFEPVYFNLADAYVGGRTGSRAYAVLEDAAKRWPKDAEIFDARGVIQIRTGALADAIASFEHATKLAPKDPLGFFNLASAHHAAALRLRELFGNRQAQLRETQEDQRLMRSSGGGGLMGMADWHRNAAVKAYRRVVALKGDYVEQARKGLAALEAK